MLLRIVSILFACWKHSSPEKTLPAHIEYLQPGRARSRRDRRRLGR